MTSKTGPSIFVPSDKNVFDALLQKRVTHSSLLGFLIDRGIFVSPKTEKYELVNLISSLTLDYHDYIWITTQLEHHNRKEKSTYSVVKAEVSTDELDKACQQVREKMNLSEEAVKVVKTRSSTKIIVTYIDVDFTKTELNQRTKKTCEVELHSKEGELLIKMPSNPKAKEITKYLKDSLNEQKGTEIEEFVISLESFAEAKARSYFFNRLITSIEGFNFDNVSSVDVYHDVDSLDEDEDEDENNSDVSARIAGYITKAVLAGNGVLESKEFSQLHKENFFISKIVWTSSSKIFGGDKIELEAQFGHPSSCTDFKYLVRGVYNYNDRTKLHNISRRSATPVENREYCGLIRQAAEKAYKAVFEEYGS
ncbi:hypothetical protein [Shewanella sp. SR43-4]|uniref:hypothetical protein n=1 Tax=Shewanella sp. SR43-4 TaxID=2760942 RepID=UPI001C72640F|nr:hypothetical protein [Shewanella sp. SR43-4]